MRTQVKRACAVNSYSIKGLDGVVVLLVSSKAFSAFHQRRPPESLVWQNLAGLFFTSMSQNADQYYANYLVEIKVTVS